MELHEALELFQNQIVNMDSLWAYYSSATLAVLGFTVASDKATRSRHEISVIQLGFLLFAIGNAFSIAASQVTLIKLNDLVTDANGSVEIVSAFPVPAVIAFHIIVTLSVLLIVEVTYRYNKSLKQDK
jgi:hypothetical protein